MSQVALQVLVAILPRTGGSNPNLFRDREMCTPLHHALVIFDPSVRLELTVAVYKTAGLPINQTWNKNICNPEEIRTPIFRSVV